MCSFLQSQGNKSGIKLDPYILSSSFSFVLLHLQINFLQNKTTQTQKQVTEKALRVQSYRGIFKWREAP